MHSSLSNCGHFIGGPAKVLSVLREFCDTLCLPTHTYSCYPSSPNQPGSVYNAATAPSEMGLLAETFRTQTGVIRSIHATHSLAAAGRFAGEICSNHYRCDTACGIGTPYERLVQRHASVLMFGVTFRYYTLFHTAEWISGSDCAYELGELNWLRFVDERGETQDCWSKRQGRALPRFDEAGSLLERAGIVRRVKLGRSHLLYVPDCAVVHDFLVERLVKTPNFLRQSCKMALG